MVLGCETAPTGLLGVLHDLDIELDYKSQSTCTTSLIAQWESEVTDSVVTETFKKYLQDHQIKKVSFSHERLGYFSCDKIQLQFDQASDYKQPSACDPTTFDGTAMSDEVKLNWKVVESTLFIKTFSQEQHENIYEYFIEEEAAGTQKAFIELLTVESGNKPYLSFEELNDYSHTFPISLTDRAYSQTEVCSKTDELMKLTAK